MQKLEMPRLKKLEIEQNNFHIHEAPKIFYIKILKLES